MDPVEEIHESGYCPLLGRQQKGHVCQVVFQAYAVHLCRKAVEILLSLVCVLQYQAYGMAYVPMMCNACIQKGSLLVRSATPAGADNNTSEVEVPTTYTVSVYAKKDGYLNSETVTDDIDVRGLKGDVNGDGEVDIADAVRIVNFVVGKINALARQRQTSPLEPE